MADRQMPNLKSRLELDTGGVTLRLDPEGRWRLAADGRITTVFHL